MAMERISTVARDRSAQYDCWSVLAIACVAVFGVISVTLAADPARPGTRTKRPQRPLQAQRSDEAAASQDTVDAAQGGDPAVASGGNAGANTSDADPLPAHVHP